MNHKNHLLNSKKIAVVRTDRLGDMVLTLPLCKALKNKLPDAELTVIARSYTEPIINKIPIIDNMIFIDNYEGGIKQILKYNKFDSIFFPRPRFDEAFAAYINGIKLRVGSAYRLYSIFYNHKVWEHRKKGNKHEAEYNVGLLENLLEEKIEVSFPEMVIPERIELGLKQKLQRLNIKNNFVIVHPGSGGSSFDWSPENFGQLSEKIVDKFDLDVLITGIKSEFEICEKVLQNSNFKAKNLCGLFSLDEMLVLLKSSKLLIANSTGVLHIASMFNTPIVGLYPNTSHISKRRWGPLNEESIVISPKFENETDKDNMNLISIEEVFSAVNQIIKL